jgi:hypothetical protein
MVTKYHAMDRCIAELEAWVELKSFGNILSAWRSNKNDSKHFLSVKVAFRTVLETYIVKIIDKG